MVYDIQKARVTRTLCRFTEKNLCQVNLVSFFKRIIRSQS